MAENNEVVNRRFADRAESLDQVKKKLRSGWRNDDRVLNQYFQSCVANWKMYKGERTPKQVQKLQAVYKQATIGDNTEMPPMSLDTSAGGKWKQWYDLRGMPQDMAKRRFITFLSEINPILIDVMPDEKPPPGFPLNRKGQPICAKCNTMVGCARPLLDDNKVNLQQQLFETPELHEPEKFRAWVRNALQTQRCVWGVHQPIARAQLKPFKSWFDRDENRGFFAYDSAPIMLMIKELVLHHYDLAFEMMQHKEDPEDATDPEEYNQQAIRCGRLKEIYEELVGEEFEYEAPCTRDVESCNNRRISEGGKNHMHKFEIDPPVYVNAASFELAVELRMQCQKLGLNPSTGVTKDINERCEIYRERIEAHYEAMRKAEEAKMRNENRHKIHKQEKLSVSHLSTRMIERQCWDACHMQMVEKVLTIVRRGCNPDAESLRGLTPLICFVVNDPQIDMIEELLVPLKANPNYVNGYGLSALMVACRRNSTKMIHVLMKNGAVASLAGKIKNVAGEADKTAASQNKDAKQLGLIWRRQLARASGRTALHWCVVHGVEELVKIIVQYLQEGVGDALRVNRFLDAVSDEGMTALMVGAERRSLLMCHLLFSLGANPNIRDNKGRTAAFIAREKGWVQIADWLEKKVGAGVAKLQTFADLQFEKQSRFGNIKMKDLVCNFCRLFVQIMIGEQKTAHPLGPPFCARKQVLEKGERAEKEQRAFIDRYQWIFLGRGHHPGHIKLPSSSNSSSSSSSSDRKESDTSSSFGSGLAKTKTKIAAMQTPEATATPAPRQKSAVCTAAVSSLEERGGSQELQDLVVNMHHVLQQMLALMRDGWADPNTQADAKPLPWTPLMCAVAACDTRTVKLMMLEGADPNHYNMDGTTPLMLAAQLQSVNMMTELILQEGNPTAVDTEGNSVFAYAESLPPPTSIKHSEIEVIMSGMTSAPKYLSATEFIKLALHCGLEKLKKAVEFNASEASMENVDHRMKLMHLLEKYGLSRMHNKHDMMEQVKGLEWRVGEERPPETEDDNSSRGGGGGGRLRRSGSMDSLGSNSSLEAHVQSGLRRFEEEEEAERKKKADELAASAAKGELRCPMCTLQPPCSHFFKVSLLKTYLENKAAAQKAEEEKARRATTPGGTQRRFVSTKKLTVNRNRAKEILEETYLADRKSDRSKTVADKYRWREIKVTDEMEQRAQAIAAAEEAILQLEAQQQKQAHHIKERREQERLEIDYFPGPPDSWTSDGVADTTPPAESLSVLHQSAAEQQAPPALLLLPASGESTSTVESKSGAGSSVMPVPVPGSTQSLDFNANADSRGSGSGDCSGRDPRESSSCMIGRPTSQQRQQQRGDSSDTSVKSALCSSLKSNIRSISISETSTALTAMQNDTDDADVRMNTGSNLDQSGSDKKYSARRKKRVHFVPLPDDFEHQQELREFVRRQKQEQQEQQLSNEKLASSSSPSSRPSSAVSAPRSAVQTKTSEKLMGDSITGTGTATTASNDEDNDDEEEIVAAGHIEDGASTSRSDDLSQASPLFPFMTTDTSSSSTLVDGDDGNNDGDGGAAVPIELSEAAPLLLQGLLADSDDEGDDATDTGSAGIAFDRKAVSSYKPTTVSEQEDLLDRVKLAFQTGVLPQRFKEELQAHPLMQPGGASIQSTGRRVFLFTKERLDRGGHTSGIVATPPHGVVGVMHNEEWAPHLLLKGSASGGAVYAQQRQEEFTMRRDRHMPPRRSKKKAMIRAAHIAKKLANFNILAEEDEDEVEAGGNDVDNLSIETSGSVAPIEGDEKGTVNNSLHPDHNSVKVDQSGKEVQESGSIANSQNGDIEPGECSVDGADGSGGTGTEKISLKKKKKVKFEPEPAVSKANTVYAGKSASGVYVLDKSRRMHEGFEDGGTVDVEEEEEDCVAKGTVVNGVADDEEKGKEDGGVTPVIQMIPAKDMNGVSVQQLLALTRVSFSEPGDSKNNNKKIVYEAHTKSDDALVAPSSCTLSEKQESLSKITTAGALNTSAPYGKHSSVVDIKSATESLIAQKVRISGYLFVSAGDTTSNFRAPFEDITLSMASWGSALDKLNKHFSSSILAHIIMEPLIDVRTWKPAAPRCAVCLIGFVRFGKSVRKFRANPESYLKKSEKAVSGAFDYCVAVNAARDREKAATEARGLAKNGDAATATGGGGGDKEAGEGTPSEPILTNEPPPSAYIKDEHLCLACVLRRRLFDLVTLSLSRTARRELAQKRLIWPFYEPAKPPPISQSLLLASKGKLEGFDAFSTVRSNPLTAVADGDGKSEAVAMLTKSSLDMAEATAAGRPKSPEVDNILQLNRSAGFMPQQHDNNPDLLLSNIHDLDNVSVLSEGTAEGFDAIKDSHLKSGSGIPVLTNLPLYHHQHYNEISTGSQNNLSSSFQQNRSTTSASGSRSSPIKSMKLDQMDEVETYLLQANGSLWDGDEHTEEGGGHHSVAGSMMSSLSASIARGGEGGRRADDHSLASSQSSKSALTQVNPQRAPRELVLLPYLVSKGLFEEGERTVRVALGKTAVDEAEGMLVLAKLMSLQAEMYKLLGVWPLALAVYLDCTDMCAALLGFNDSYTRISICLVSNCLRKMGQHKLGSAYVGSLCRIIESEMMKRGKKEVIKNIRFQERQSLQSFADSTMIRNELEAYVPSKTRPTQVRLNYCLGLAGFYNFLTSVEGYFVIARGLFFAHLLQREAAGLGPEGVGMYGEFLDYTLRLRSCDDPQLYRHLVQHMVQRQLSKKLSAKSVLAKQYRLLSSHSDLEAVMEFMKHGMPVGVQTFDSLLKYTILLLVPEYKRFLLFEPAGGVLREYVPELIAEVYHVACTIIQCMVRRKIARRVVPMVRELRRIEHEKRRIAEKKNRPKNFTTK